MEPLQVVKERGGSITNSSGYGSYFVVSVGTWRCKGTNPISNYNTDQNYSCH